MYLIVGLGNPGRQYANTRHNVGWMVLERAAGRWGLSWIETASARQCSGSMGTNSFLLALPKAWMNQTGPVVRHLVDRFGIRSQELIVVHDDLDLKLGAIRIKTRGGAGGHNGVQSVLLALQTEKFIRVKIGIGRPPEYCDPADYVLSPFKSEELPIVDQVLSRGVDALECILNEGVGQAMNRFNVREKKG